MSQESTTPIVNQGTGGSSAWKVDGNGGTFPTDGLTDTQLRATPVPVSGTVTATGPLTDTQLRATPVPVSGTVTATGPLTDTQLRATPVPVSGTITATGPLTDTQLRATPVPVSGTVTATAAGTQDTNLISVNGVTQLTGSGATGTGSERVTVAIDSATVAGSASLPAGTNIIGKVSQDTSPWVISGSVDTTSLAVVSAANSSTTPLGGGGVFTGTAVDMLNYSTVRISIFSDKASATNGWQIQFSEDATNWDFIRSTTYAAGVGGYTVFNRVARYCRIVYTNGASAQATFRLQTLFAPNSPEFARHFISEVPNDNNGCIITQALIVGKTTGGGGGYVDVKVAPSGALAADVSGSTGLSTALTQSAITATGGSFASSGNNTLITPSNSLRINYLCLSAAAANTAAVLCIVKFTTGGSTLFEVQLLPGAIWAHHIAAGQHYVTGTAGQALVVNLDSAQTVYWSLEYADV